MSVGTTRVPIWCGEGIVSAITMVSRERIPPVVVVDNKDLVGLEQLCTAMVLETIQGAHGGS